MTTLYEEVSKYTSLKRSGNQFKGLSPFIKENTPSFFIKPTANGGLWKCFSTGLGGLGVESFLKALKERKPDSFYKIDYEPEADSELPF